MLLRSRCFLILACVVLALTTTLLYFGQYLEPHTQGFIHRFPTLNLGGGSRDASPLSDVHEPETILTAPTHYVHDLTTGGYRWYTESTLRNLAACSARGDCHPNAQKIAIFGAWFCHLAVFDNYNGGEGVWCLGMMDSLRRQGYTVLLARNDWPYINHIYRQIPDLVKVIVADAYGPKVGVDDDVYIKRLKSEDRPDGIPAWKFFFFYYFPTVWSTIVGNKWVVSGELPLNNQRGTYLGYSVDTAGLSERYIPFEQRPYRVYLLGKYDKVFYPPTQVAWEHDWYQRVTDDLRKRWPTFEIVGGIVHKQTEEQLAKDGPWSVPKGIRNLGKLNSTEFDTELANSRLLLGVGSPTLSPSPYRALALGVPFLNPQFGARFFQHNTVAGVGEPYSYNVKEKDYEGFKAAIEKAMEAAIEPWVAPWMERDTFDKRMDDFMNHDWRSEAATILEERERGNETQTTIDGAPPGKLGMFEL